MPKNIVEARVLVISKYRNNTQAEGIRSVLGEGREVVTIGKSLGERDELTQALAKPDRFDLIFVCGLLDGSFPELFSLAVKAGYGPEQIVALSADSILAINATREFPGIQAFDYDDLSARQLVTLVEKAGARSA